MSELTSIWDDRAFSFYQGKGWQCTRTMLDNPLIVVQTCTREDYLIPGLPYDIWVIPIDENHVCFQYPNSTVYSRLEFYRTLEGLTLVYFMKKYNSGQVR